MAYLAARAIRGGLMAVGLVLALAGCSTVENVASPNVTDAPVGAGVDIPAGSTSRPSSSPSTRSGRSRSRALPTNPAPPSSTCS